MMFFIVEKQRANANMPSLLDYGWMAVSIFGARKFHKHSFVVCQL